MLDVCTRHGRPGDRGRDRPRPAAPREVVGIDFAGEMLRLGAGQGPRAPASTRASAWSRGDATRAAAARRVRSTRPRSRFGIRNVVDPVTRLPRAPSRAARRRPAGHPGVRRCRGFRASGALSRLLPARAAARRPRWSRSTARPIRLPAGVGRRVPVASRPLPRCIAQCRFSQASTSIARDVRDRVDFSSAASDSPLSEVRSLTSSQFAESLRTADQLVASIASAARRATRSRFPRLRQVRRRPMKYSPLSSAPPASKSTNAHAACLRDVRERRVVEQSRMPFFMASIDGYVLPSPHMIGREEESVAGRSCDRSFRRWSRTGLRRDDHRDDRRSAPRCTSASTYSRNARQAPKRRTIDGAHQRRQLRDVVGIAMTATGRARRGSPLREIAPGQRLTTAGR